MEATKDTNLHRSFNAFLDLVRSGSSSEHPASVPDVLQDLCSFFDLSACGFEDAHGNVEIRVRSAAASEEAVREAVVNALRKDPANRDKVVYATELDGLSAHLSRIRIAIAAGSECYLVPIASDPDRLDGYHLAAMEARIRQANLALRDIARAQAGALFACSSHEAMAAVLDAVASLEQWQDSRTALVVDFFGRLTCSYFARSTTSESGGGRGMLAPSSSDQPQLGEAGTQELLNAAWYDHRLASLRGPAGLGLKDFFGRIGWSGTELVERKEDSLSDGAAGAGPGESQFHLVSDAYRQRLVACVGWRALRVQIEATRLDVDLVEEVGRDQLGRLLAMTQQLCRRFLMGSRVYRTGSPDEGEAQAAPGPRPSGLDAPAATAAGNDKKAPHPPGPDEPLDGIRIDSAFLQIYLLSRVLGSERIRCYFDLPPGHPDAGARGRDTAENPGLDERADRLRRWTPSQEETRDFLRALCVSALHGLYLMDRRWQPAFEQEFVDAAPADLTRSLLRVIDRFAVLECGLDERFGVGEHLAQAYAVDAVLYFGKSFYREHVYHVVDVFVLGLLLLDARVVDRAGQVVRSSLVSWVRERMWEGTGSDLKDDFKRDLVLQNWTLAALFHDVGYALETVEAVAPMMQQIGSDPTDAYAGVVTRALGKAESAFYRAARKRITADVAGQSRFSGSLGDLPDLERVRGPGLNHGVASFCHLLHLLMQVDRRDSVLKMSSEAGARSTRMVDCFLPALRAIFHHHLTDQPVDLHKDPISFLLILIDEVQDWGRRRIDRDEMARGLGASWKFEMRSPSPKASIVEFVAARLALGQPAATGALATPVFDICYGGLAFHLFFQRPDEAEIQPVSTVLSKAANLQRLRLRTSPWGPAERPGASGGGGGSHLGDSHLLVSCVFAVPENLYRGLRELEVYRKVAMEVPGLPYPERFERRAGHFEELLWRGSWGEMPLFGYQMMAPRERYHTRTGYDQPPPPVAPTPVSHEVFTLEVRQLGRRARPELDDPRPLFPSDPGPYFMAVDRAHRELLRRYTEQWWRGGSSRKPGGG